VPKASRRFVVGCMEFDWVMGWVGLWVQSFYFAVGWVGLKKLGPTDNSAPDAAPDVILSNYGVHTKVEVGYRLPIRSWLIAFYQIYLLYLVLLLIRYVML